MRMKKLHFKNKEESTHTHTHTHTRTHTHARTHRLGSRDVAVDQARQAGAIGPGAAVWRERERVCVCVCV
jgi:hypothetical protein